MPLNIFKRSKKKLSTRAVNASQLRNVFILIFLDQYTNDFHE